MRNNWLTRFLGLHDKSQKQKTQEVAAYVEQKKTDYKNDMHTIHKDALKAHREAKKTLKHAEKTVKITEDITQRLAIVTQRGGIKYGR